MRRIILASRSAARRRLMREAGLHFTTARTSAEEKSASRGRVDAVVIGNALRKARAAARRFRSGVVVAADTVVRCGGKTVGKPLSEDDAMKTLKRLSRVPQWVYTGLAVIDIGSGRTVTACERTKVYMRPLADAEIRSYFRKAPPRDKAGSFDVRGPGSLFVHRVEGCFYNVVGLPMARLAECLRKVGVVIR